MEKRITIEKKHFKFFYILPGAIEKPWAVPDGNEIIAKVPSDKFRDIVKQEGSEAMATAMSIGEKHTRALQKQRQDRLFN